MKQPGAVLGILIALVVSSGASMHLEIMKPELMDTDLKGPVKSVDIKVSVNVSGKFEREHTEYDETGNILNETEWNADGEMINTITNTYDDTGNFIAQLYINVEEGVTNNWDVYLSPETRQIAMKKKSTGAASVFTYNADGYLLKYRHVDKKKELVSGSITKRDEQNRRMEYTRLDRDGRPLYTYWFRWKEDDVIDRERQKYRQEKGERLHIYEYLKTDDFGNWVQRLMVRYDIGGKEKEKIYERLVVRDIEYHFDDVSPEVADGDSSAESNDTLAVMNDALSTDPEESDGASKKPDPKPVADLLKTGRSQEQLKEAFDYTFDDIADKLVIITCKSDRGRSAGSGFVAKMNGKTYLFTNQHVIMGAETIRLKTAEGEMLIPASGVELSSQRDIARIALDDRGAFDLSSSFPMGSPLGVFGNSEGAGVATELYGEVTGLGADLVEVNAEFVSGNSGSPVLDINQNVIGIASFVRVTWEPPKNEEKVEKKDEDEDDQKKTKFESKTRRFCYRMNDLKWSPVNWKTYNRKYGKLYRDSEKISKNVFDIINVWSESPVEKLPESDDMARDLAVWVDKHNDIIDRLKRRQYKERNFINAYSQSLEILSKTFHDRSRRVAMFSKQRELSGFLQGEFERNSASLEFAGYYIQAIADNIANQ